MDYFIQSYKLDLLYTIFTLINNLITLRLSKYNYIIYKYNKFFYIHIYYYVNYIFENDIKIYCN